MQFPLSVRQVTALKVTQQISATPVETWHSAVCELPPPRRWTTAFCRGISNSCDCSVTWCSSSLWIRHSVSKSIKVYQKLRMLHYVLEWGKWEICATGMIIHWNNVHVCMHLVFCEQPYGNLILYASEYFVWLYFCFCKSNRLFCNVCFVSLICGSDGVKNSPQRLHLCLNWITDVCYNNTWVFGWWGDTPHILWPTQTTLYYSSNLYAKIFSL